MAESALADGLEHPPLLKVMTLNLEMQDSLSDGDRARASLSSCVP
jgi:hypothetical protein